MELGPCHRNAGGRFYNVAGFRLMAMERSEISLGAAWVSLCFHGSTQLTAAVVHIFKHRLVNGACLTMFINGWNFLVQIYYIPSFYQLVYGYSAVKSGWLLLPITVVQSASAQCSARHGLTVAAISSTLSGLIVHWSGRYRECILVGWALWAIGLGLFSTLDETSGLAKQIGYGVLTGVGVGNTLQP